MSESPTKLTPVLATNEKLEEKHTTSASSTTEDPEVETNKENLEPEPTKSTTKPKVKPSSCVFVASLRSSKTDDDLCRSVTSHFSKFGKLISVKVLRDLSNRPYAFVQYSNDDDCRSAIELGHGSLLDGRRLRCEAAKVNRTLFIAGNSPMQLNQIESKMESFGEIELIIASSGNGQLLADVLKLESKSQNWFVKFCYRDDAIRAFASITEGAEFNVEWAQNIDDHLNPHVPKIDKLSIFVGQLSPNVTEDELKERFGAHGEISEILIKDRPNSTSAFITYKLEESAASAVAADNHSMFMNRTIHVQYKEVTARTPTRVILSPRTPIALAPPPINVRRRLLTQESRIPYGYGGREGRVPYGYGTQDTTNGNVEQQNYKVPYYRYEPSKKVLGSRDYVNWGPSNVSRRGYYNKRSYEADLSNSGHGVPYFIAPDYRAPH